ncbi:MotA/TolQ/ExbB proton channel family protein [Planctomycetes bacterium MalM25]|nr:MotA/TolQ/ExbB proton channel family protein [Planctomycetes bacterium MalM25]
MTIVILVLFSIGLVLNLMGIRTLRNEYVCAAVCLDTMKVPNGIKELVELPSAGVFHQHLKDLAAIAKHDKNLSQDGLISLLYSQLMAKSRMVDVLSGVLVTLGLIGTVVGLISMTAGLNETLSSLDDSQDASGLLSGMRDTMSGLSTAFYTTLIGAFLGSVALRVLNNVYTSNVEHLVSYIASTAEVRIVPLLKSAKRVKVDA